MRHPTKPPITKRLIFMPSPVTGQKDKPRSAGPRCGDPTAKLCHFMAAMSERNSGYAPTAAKSPGRGCGPAMRGGLRPRFRAGRASGLGDAPPHKATHHQAPDIHAFASDGAERQAAQCWAAGRRSDREAMSLYGGNVRATYRLSAHGCQIAGPWGRPSDARRPAALIPRKRANRLSPSPQTCPSRRNLPSGADPYLGRPLS